LRKLWRRRIKGYFIPVRRPTRRIRRTNFSCSNLHKLKCSLKDTFRCPSGYYPVCGDTPGWQHSQGKLRSMKECTKRCDKYHWCIGTEWLYKGRRKGFCNLNHKYPTVKKWFHRQHSCIKNNHPICPTKKIKSERPKRRPINRRKKALRFAKKRRNKGRRCAMENGGNCKCKGWVRYGNWSPSNRNKHKFTPWRKVKRIIACNNTTFGDP